MCASSLYARGVKRADARMLRTDEADEILRVEPLLVKSRLEAGNVAERKVGFARFEHVGGGGGNGRDVEPDVGTDPADMRKQPGEQRDVARIGHADAEIAVGRGRVETRQARGEPPQQRQRLAGRADERVGARRRLHAGRCPHEQRIVPFAAQFREPDAGRRLAQVEALGRTGHALGAIDLVEQDEHPGVAGDRSELGFHH